MRKWFTFLRKGHLALATLSKRLDGANEKGRKQQERIGELENGCGRLVNVVADQLQQITQLRIAVTQEIDQLRELISEINQRTCDAMELIGQLRERQPIAEVKKGPIVARTWKQFQSAVGDAAQPQEGESNVS